LHSIFLGERNHNVDNDCNIRQDRRNDEGRTFSSFWASSLGTVFEWYDSTLRIARQHYRRAVLLGLSPATRDIFALLAFAAGFLVRPFGAIVFGRIGDIVGRKYTFLVTILIMGPVDLHRRPAAQRGHHRIAAPIILIALRLLQGLALGGEYGWCGNLRGRACPDGQARLLHVVHPDHGDARPVPVAAGDPVHSVPRSASPNSRLGLAYSVPGVGGPARRFGLDPAAPERIAGVPEDEGRGQELEGSADRSPSPTGATPRS